MLQKLTWEHPKLLMSLTSIFNLKLFIQNISILSAPQNHLSPEMIEALVSLACEASFSKQELEYGSCKQLLIDANSVISDTFYHQVFIFLGVAPSMHQLQIDHVQSSRRTAFYSLPDEILFMDLIRGHVVAPATWSSSFFASFP